jgi:hypothetical protein
MLLQLTSTLLYQVLMPVACHRIQNAEKKFSLCKATLATNGKLISSKVIGTTSANQILDQNLHIQEVSKSYPSMNMTTRY